MNDAVELLKQVSTFSMLPDELLHSLATHMRQRLCADRELLFHIGDPGDSLFIIASGQITVFLEISGRQLTLQEFGPGGAIGELALIDGNPRSASAMAIGETVTWCLEREAFRKALLENPELVMVMLSDLLVKLRFATSFIEEVVSWSRAVAEANYDHALKILEKSETEDMEALERLDLPDSLYALVLSRIDQLDESEQLTIKIASVIGRLFRAAMLWGVYPDLPLNQVQHNLDVLSHLELTPLDTPLPELAYLFKHIVTQQVAYESLLHSTRAMLHEQIGLYTERTYPDTLEEYINLLAFHFEHSENESKKREYLLKAGETAQKDYANSAAITYFEKSLPMLEGRALVDTRLKLGQAQELTGQWDHAGQQFETALAEAEILTDKEAIAWCQTAMGELSRKRNQYDIADDWFVQARKTFEALGNKAGIGQVLHYAGSMASQQGNKPLAVEYYSESLLLRKELGDRENEASLLSNLGIVSRDQGMQDAARRYNEESLAIREAIGNRWGTAVSLNNLGNLAIDDADYVGARDLFERALLIWREIGERWATTNTIHNLANVAREEGDFQEAERLYMESIDGWGELDDRWGTAYWLEDTGLLQLRLNEPEPAMQLIGAAAALREEIGAPRPPAYDEILQKRLLPARQALGAETADAAMKTGQALELDQAIDLALTIDLEGT